MVCPKCGRELREGETCPCSSGLPDAKAVLEDAKNAVRAIKSSPFVSELLVTARGAFTAPEKQVADNAERIDILWVLLLPIEAAALSFGFTSVLRRTLFAAVGSARYGDFSKAMKAAGMGALKMFGLHFLLAAAGVILCVIAAMIFARVCKKKRGFSETANLMTTVLVPAAALMAAAGFGALVYAPLGVLLGAAAGMSALLLGYRAACIMVTGETKFPKLWLYIIFAAAVTAVLTAMETGLLKTLLDGAELFG